MKKYESMAKLIDESLTFADLEGYGIHKRAHKEIEIEKIELKGVVQSL